MRKPIMLGELAVQAHEDFLTVDFPPNRAVQVMFGGINPRERVADAVRDIRGYIRTTGCEANADAINAMLDDLQIGL